jgi:hypothetical protein
MEKRRSERMKKRFTKTEDAMLIEMWYSNMMGDEVARRLGRTVDSVDHRWKKLRTIGKLPKGPRPTSPIRSKANSKYADWEPGDEIDGRPTVKRDKLLGALYREHPEKLLEDVEAEFNRQFPNGEV